MIQRKNDIALNCSLWLNVIPCSHQVLPTTSKIHLNINTAKEENLNTEVINGFSFYHDPFVRDPEINKNNFLCLLIRLVCIIPRLQVSGDFFLILLDNITSRRRKVESTSPSFSETVRIGHRHRMQDSGTQLVGVWELSWDIRGRPVQKECSLNSNCQLHCLTFGSASPPPSPPCSFLVFSANFSEQPRSVFVCIQNFLHYDLALGLQNTPAVQREVLQCVLNRVLQLFQLSLRQRIPWFTLNN